LYTFRAGKLLREIESLRIPILLGHTKRASDSTWTERDRRRRGKYHHELVAKLRKDRIDVCIVYAWREGVKLRIAKHVRFIGSRSDVPQVLRALDVFAIPSFHEGTPFAMLEAMAMGLPIVASQVGSIPEIIVGESGESRNGQGVKELDKTCHQWKKQALSRFEVTEESSSFLPSPPRHKSFGASA